ncbi:Sodium-dependent phosphate transporter 1-B [Blattella germanica]|nr:Sodium-dependent phosphate transporter 1-B [Blattella germanica]
MDLSSTTEIIMTTMASLEPFSMAPEVLWLIVIGFLMAFVLAFGIGANDVANSFGTSVGSKVLTVKQACCLATVFEIAGAVLIGYKVSDTMRKGILEVNLYEGAERELMLGCLASLMGSWFISPVLSGLMSVVLFKLIRRFILLSPHPLVPGLRALPFFYGITILVNVFSIVHDGPTLLYFDHIPWWGALLISFGVGILSMLLVQFVLVPYQKKRIVGELLSSSPHLTLIVHAPGCR